LLGKISEITSGPWRHRGLDYFLGAGANDDPRQPGKLSSADKKDYKEIE
jgi:hypothetical protein